MWISRFKLLLGCTVVLGYLAPNSSQAARFDPSRVLNEAQGLLDELGTIRQQAGAVNADSRACVAARIRAFEGRLGSFATLVGKGDSVNGRTKARAGVILINSGKQAVVEARQCITTVDFEEVSRLAFGLISSTSQLSRVSSASGLE